MKNITLCLMMILLLLSCRMESDYEVQQTRYSDKSELYGVWNIQTRDYLGIGYEPSSMYYVWGGPDSSYFMDGGSWDSDSGKVYKFFIGKNDWILEQNHIVQLSEAWAGVLFNARFAYTYSSNEWPECIRDAGVSYCIWTVSDLDSLKEASRLYKKVGLFSVGTPPRYAITQDKMNARGARSLYLVDDECFQANSGADNLKGIVI